MKEEGRTGDTSWLKVVRYGAALYNIWQGDQGKGKGETTVADSLEVTPPFCCQILALRSEDVV